MQICIHRALGSVFFFFVSFLMTTSALAANYTWSVTSGDWSVASNWGGMEPTSGGTAYINNGGTASITAAREVCNILYLGQSVGNSGSVSMTSGTLSSN